MSRCFPFPPPGYEKKSRAEDADLLKKEKSKEKKHKKEKKDKEKKEGKEKRDKDKSDEKRREKKDKKKDRDKKKERDKEKEKEKEKAHTLEESRPSGKIRSQNGEEVVRIKPTSIQEEKHAAQFDSYIGNKISQNTVLPKETKNSKLVPEVGRRVEDSGTAKVEKFAVAQPKRDDGVATQVARSSETLFEGKEQIKNKTIDQRKFNGQGIRHEERFSGNSAVPSFTATATTATATATTTTATATTTANATATATVESGVVGIKSLEKTAERRKETNDKIKQKEGDEKRGSRHKDKDKEKKGRSNDKEKKKEKKAKAKEKKKEKEKEKEKVEEKNAVVDKTKEITKDNLLGRHSTNTNTSQLPDSNIGAAVEENIIKKRKVFEPNGVLHAIDNRPSKLLKPISHPLKENGRILEPCLTSTLPPSERQAVANDLILVSKERKINGIIEAHHPPASLKHKSGGQDDHPQPTAIHKKSPHPDSKYLSVVYSVPKMEELSDSDNQDWLLSSNTSQVMKPKLEASGAEEMPQVWAEAMQIEPTDVYALPYVIPY